MRLLRQTLGWYALLPLLAGCSPGLSTPRVPGPVSMPQGTQAVVPASPIPGSRTFRYMPGVLMYRISRNAAIEGQADLVSRREISTNATHETLMLEPSGNTITITATIDTFSNTTQGMIGSVQPAQLPIEVTGTFTDDSLVINGEGRPESCSPVSSVLMTDLHSLLTNFPVQLSSGMTWRDSLDVTGCQANIPTALHLVRTFLVSGQVIYEGEFVLLIQRSDSIRAHGDGAQLQHRMLVETTGVGHATYYLNPALGRLIRLSASQILQLTVTASGRTYQFTENSWQEFNLVR